MAFMYYAERHVTDKFAAMFVVILATPWSICLALFSGFIIEPLFKYEFTYNEIKIVLSACVILNTILIFFIAKKIRAKRDANAK